MGKNKVTDDTIVIEIEIPNFNSCRLYTIQERVFHRYEKTLDRKGRLGRITYETFHWLKWISAFYRLPRRPIKRQDFRGYIETVYLGSDSEEKLLLRIGNPYEKEIIMITKYLKFIIEKETKKEITINLLRYRNDNYTGRLLEIKTTRSDLIGKNTFLNCNFIDKLSDVERYFYQRLVHNSFGSMMFSVLHENNYYIRDGAKLDKQLKQINWCLEEQGLKLVESLEEARNFIHPHFIEKGIDIVALTWQEFDPEIMNAVKEEVTIDTLKNELENEPENDTENNTKLTW